LTRRLLPVKNQRQQDARKAGDIMSEQRAT
jgi:hypothetical protein